MMDQHDPTAQAARRQTGGRVIARTLVENGVTDMFGIHGYINNVLEEACRLGVNNVHFRHEQSAGFAADAYGRLKRKAGVCYASASGGMSNYLAPLSQGIGALSPIVLLVGQHGTAADGLEALQEGYAAECFKPVTKWTKRLTDWELNAYWTQKALRETCAYPPGPVCLEVPLNNQWAFGSGPQRKVPARGRAAPDAALRRRSRARRTRGAAVDRCPPSAGDRRRRRLLVRGIDALNRLATTLSVPVNSRRTARGAVSESGPLGVPAAARSRLLADADLIVLVRCQGRRAGELVRGAGLATRRRPLRADQRAGRGPLVRVATEVMIAGSSRLVLEELVRLCESDADRTAGLRAPWLAKLREVRASLAERRERASAGSRTAGRSTRSSSPASSPRWPMRTLRSSTTPTPARSI
jgi:acetolactate synthase-1/2/3 large subunit